MTIEVCAAKDATKYEYQPPRAPLATKFPTKKEWPFKCIGGAQYLAAASSFAASVYMMI